MVGFSFCVPVNMEFGVCTFLGVTDVTRLLMTCRDCMKLPLPYNHLVPRWCPPQCAKVVAMLHAGYASELINVKEQCYNLCCELPNGTLFAGTYNTSMPLKIDNDWRATYCYLGIRDVFDMCSLSNGDVVVANKGGTRRFNLNFDARSIRFTSYTFSKILSVNCKGLVYGVVADPSAVIRVNESHECLTLVSMRNPIIAVTDFALYVASCLDGNTALYFVEHDKILLKRFAVFPSAVLQVLGMPNGKVAVRCSDLNVYLCEHTKPRLAFEMGTGHMVRIGDVIYCHSTCLCTTTCRLYRHSSGNNFIGDCRQSSFALSKGLRLAIKRYGF